MAYDALQETAPSRAVKEYLKILKLKLVKDPEWMCKGEICSKFGPRGS